ncbi:outer membrane beta-barrel family protein [Pedobacter sp. SYSU D00535]|uniref:outer membrane beta-barrel family protein n=1 Tax=Pedobacter sp. SYSU D00535 TaxID=2810308 RepID=UPI001A97204C|nr:outer membrane beta-barrel family protein [Pedobacter sp. SYSU D00535]
MKPLQSTICLFLLLALMQATSQAQTKISGQVTDDKQKNLDFATVTILQAGDSSLVKSTVTDSAGRFRFEKINPGSYILAVSFHGFKKHHSKVDLKSADTEVTLPPIAMAVDSKTLKEVTVTSKKPFIERRADKLIMNVESSAVAVGNTALEVLKKAPGVSLDKDDNISMNGKNSVLVMLDGKPTYMSNADLANLLRSMQSSEIESIELITNPSAKYDAAGNGGIINIKTKRNKNLGFNGSVTVGSGYGRTSKYNGSTNLNFRKGAINVFGSYNYSNNGNISSFEMDRVVTDRGIVTNFEQNNIWDGRRDNNGYKAGIDYFVTKKTTIGLLYNGYSNSVSELANSGTNIFNGGFQLDSSISVLGNNRQRYVNNAINFNLKTNLDTMGRELTFDADYSKYNGKLDEFRDSYYTGFANNAGVEKVNNLAPADIEIISAKLDYTHPLNKRLKIETGLKSSWVTTDNNFRFSNFISQAWVSDAKRSNHFIYKENINAAYLNLNKEFKSTTVQLGLRGEHTNSNGNSITLDSVVKRDYFKLFPSLSISQKLGKNHQVGLSISRRIDRPSYHNLNPFIYVLDKYTYEQGNSRLNPQFTNSAELSYTFKSSTTFTLGYSKTSNVMTQITEQDNTTKVTFVQQRNLDDQTVYSFNVFAPIKVTSWWNMNNNGQVFNLGFTADLFGERLKASQTVFQFNTDQQFTISKTLGAELSSWYMSPLQYGMFHIRNSPFVNIGFKKSFQDNKLNMKLSMNDIFNTQRNRGSTSFANMNFNFRNKWESQVVNFSLSYRFGNNNVKPERKRSTGLESESSRMKN